MSEIIRILGFITLAVLVWGLVQGDSFNKINFFLMTIVGLIMILIGYVGDLIEAVETSTQAHQEKIDNINNTTAK